MGALITVSDLQMQNGEPRVEDLVLAGALGFSDRHMIRTLIKRHIEALQRFGEVSVMQRKPGSKGGRPSKVFYLNEEQSIFITAKSDTPRAAEITVEMVRVFRAYIKGESTPARVRAPRRNTINEEVARRIAVLEAQVKMLAAAAVTGRELYGVVMNGNVRVEKGEEPDFGTALENVMADRITRASGGIPSGKTLLLLEKDYGQKKPAFPDRKPWKPDPPAEPRWPSHPHVWERHIPDGHAPTIDNTKKCEKLPDGCLALPLEGGGYSILPPR